MKETDKITIRAFLIALSELDSPLPKEQQTRLQEIAENVAANLGKLDGIIESYPPLDALYQKARTPLHDHSRERSKADLPIIDQAVEQQSTETSNTLVVQLENMEEKQLIETAKKVFPSANPAATIIGLLCTGYPA